MRRFVLFGMVSLCWLGSLGLTAGCSGAGEANRSGVYVAGTEPSVSSLRTMIRERDNVPPDSFYVSRLRFSGVTPVYGARFRLGSGVVAGFVPGRHPLYGGELVLLVVRAEGPPALAMLEAVRMLAAGARYSTRPERTVLVAFLPASSGAAALDVLTAALPWERTAVRAMLIVEPDAAVASRAEAVAGRQAWPLRFLQGSGASQGEVSEALDLARATLEAVLSATEGAPRSMNGAAPDSSSVGSGQ